MFASVAAAGQSHHYCFQAGGQPQFQRKESGRGESADAVCSSNAPSDFQIVYEKRKKSEGKMVRAERQLVLDMLFSAFEKHQYYNIKELVDITKQPVVSSTHTHKHKLA